MEFNHLPDLLSTGITIIEIGLYYGGEHRTLGSKNMQIPDFSEQHDDVCLFEEPLSRWLAKALQILVEIILILH